LQLPLHACTFFVFIFCTIPFALVKSYKLLWKLHKCIGVERSMLFFTFLLTIKTLNVFGFWSWSFIIHCVSFVLHLAITNVVFCCKVHLWNKGGRSNFSLPTFDNCCVHSSTPLVYTKSPNFVSTFHPFHFYLKVCYASGKRPWRDYLDNSTIYSLNSKP